MALLASWVPLKTARIHSFRHILRLSPAWRLRNVRMVQSEPATHPAYGMVSGCNTHFGFFDVFGGIAGSELRCITSGLGFSIARFPLTPSLSLGEREIRSPVLEVVRSRGFTMRRQRCFPHPGGEGPRVRGKGANEYEGFPLSNSGLTDAPCPAFTHWKRRGTNFVHLARVRREPTARQVTLTKRAAARSANFTP